MGYGRRAINALRIMRKAGKRLAGFASLYALMISPRLRRRPLKAPHMGVLYAHRGLFDNNRGIPENSMMAFRRAVEAGYGIELDVQTTKDKVPVIFHDFMLERMARTPSGEKAAGRISDYTYEELSELRLLDTDERIPTLKEFLGMVAGRVPLIVELKIEVRDITVCREASRLLDKYGGVYCVESFHPLGILWFRLNRPKVMRGQLAESFRKSEGWLMPQYWLAEFLMLNFVGRPDFIAYNFRHRNNISRILCTKLFRAIPVAWTIRSEEDLAACRRDFDMIIFDSFLPEGGPWQGRQGKA